jgi:hypothetical protein
MQGSQFYEFDHKKSLYKDNALTDDLGICRTRDANGLAGGERGHELNCGFSPYLLSQKVWRGD